MYLPSQKKFNKNNMEVQIIKDGDVDVFMIAGRVDTATSAQLDEVVTPYFSKNGSKVIFDCGNMEYISSAGLRVFLSAHKNIAMKGGEFSIRNLSSQVKSVFDMTGFSKILNIIG